MLSPTVSPSNRVRVTLKSGIDTTVFVGEAVAVDALYNLARTVTDITAHQLAYTLQEANPVAIEDHAYLIVQQDNGNIVALAEAWIDQVMVLDPTTTLSLTVLDLTETARAKLLAYMTQLGITYTID